MCDRCEDRKKDDFLRTLIGVYILEAGVPKEKLKETIDATIEVLNESKHIGSMKTGSGRESASSRMALHPDQTKLRNDATAQYGTAFRKMQAQLDRKIRRLILHYETTDAVSTTDPEKPASRTALTRSIKDAIKDAYLEAYRYGVLSTGIKKVSSSHETELTDEERKWVMSAFSHEMTYFNRMMDQYFSGSLRGRIVDRLRAYATTVGAIYDAGRIRSLPENVLIHWVMHPAEHCKSCLELSRHSPYTAFSLPATPKGGATECLSNCKCTLKIVKSTPEEVERVANKNLRDIKVMKQRGLLKLRGVRVK